LNSINDTSLILTLRFGKHKVRLPSFFRWPVIVFSLLVIAVLILFPYTSRVQKFNLPRVGEVSKETVIAPISFDVVKSQAVLDRERKEALSQVLLLFEEIPEKTKKVLGLMAEFRRQIHVIATEKVASKKKDIIDTHNINVYKKNLSEQTIQILIDRPSLIDDVYYQVRQSLERGIVNVLLVPSTQKLDQLRNLYGKPFRTFFLYDKLFVTVRKGDVERSVRITDLTIKEIAMHNILEVLKNESNIDQNTVNVVYEVLDHYLAPNIILNEAESNAKRENALSTILPIKGKVVKDAEIVRKHQDVTEDIVEKLMSLQNALESDRHNAELFRVIRNNVSRIVFILFFFCLIGLFTFHHYREQFRRPRYLSALAVIIVAQIALIRICQIVYTKLFNTGTEQSLLIIEFAVPFIFASILASILFSSSIGYLVALTIAIYAACALTVDVFLFFYILAGGLVAAYYIRKVRYRLDFFKAMLPVIGVHALFVTLWSLQTFEFSFVATLQNIGLACFGGFFSLLIAMFTIVFFEYTFDIATDIILVELSDMNHPLLKRLSIEAPGTYNHSVLVGNLAESGALRVDANPLLARVASYYHDVGKLSKPNYFTENQRFEKNIHDKLSPHMSTLIISSHIKDGVELARTYRIPSVIQNAIWQHHGTSTVSFFYEKARELDPDTSLKEEDFCYPGPKPQTKENAIIMLADSIEAASRSLAQPSLKTLRQLVKRIIQDKFASSQLDECDLSFNDLERIVEGFMPVLQGIFHTRVEYPQPLELRPPKNGDPAPEV
jgi:putative nucleotidyltransferase with HDIG domain